MNVSVVRAEDYRSETIRIALLKAFQLLGLNTGNPFSAFIKPGDNVFIKPNWVAHRYRASCPMQHDVYTTITHPSIIREIAKFVDLALMGRGKITIGDNPSIDADFSELMRLQQLESLKDELNTPLEILDLRPLVCTDLANYGQKDKMVGQQGDPNGETVINLKKDSLLYGLQPKLFRGVFRERKECVDAHTGESQLYSFSNSIFNADVFISVPKLKTHHKVGTTLNLKGLVGTVSQKNFLVHWREGFPFMGGDAYPNLWLWFSDFFRKVKKRGAWNGNDTIWRMVVDLYSCIQQGPKAFFSVVDGVLGGQGDGPFCPEPIKSEVILAGSDFLTTDLVATRLMGFAVEEIPYLNFYLKKGLVKKEEIQIVSEDIKTAGFFEGVERYLAFKPPSKWPNLTRGMA